MDAAQQTSGYGQSKSMDARLKAVGATREDFSPAGGSAYHQEKKIRDEVVAAKQQPKQRAKRERRFILEHRLIGSKNWRIFALYVKLDHARDRQAFWEAKFSALWTKYRVRRTDLKVVA